MNDMDWREEEEDQRTACRLTRTEQRPQAPCFLSVFPYRSAGGLDPNHQRTTTNDQHDNSDTSIIAERLPGIHLQQEQPKVTPEERDTESDATIIAEELKGWHQQQSVVVPYSSSPVSHDHMQETPARGGYNRSYQQLDTHTAHCIGICPQHGVHVFMPLCPVSSPSETTVPSRSIPSYRSSYEDGDEDRDLTIALQQSQDSWRQERERRKTEEQNSIRVTYAMSLMKHRTRDPNGVLDWDEVDPEDPDNFDMPWNIRRRRTGMNRSMDAGDEEGTMEDDRSNNDEEGRM